MKIQQALLIIQLYILFLGSLSAQVPSLLNYQGRVVVGTTNFEGPGYFKFALVNTNASTTYWSNDGSSSAGSQPTNGVTLTVSKGLYSVLIGDTSLSNMNALPTTVFANSDVRLRVWFNDGTNGFQLLTPDKRIAAVGYAMMAQNVPDSAITSSKLANGAVTSTKITNNSIGSSHIAAGAIGTSHIASGSITQSLIAPGAISSAQLAKPIYSGRITAVTDSYFRIGKFSVNFASAFSSLPIVTCTTLGADTNGQESVITNIDTTNFGGIYQSGLTSSTVQTVPESASQFRRASQLVTTAGNPSFGLINRDDNSGIITLNYVRSPTADGQTPSWATTSITTLTTEAHPDILIVNNNPAIFFYDNNTLRFVRSSNQTGTAWNTPVTVDTSVANPDSPIDYFSLNLAKHLSSCVVNLNPAVAYYDITNGNLKYARSSNTTGTAWGAPVVVQSSGDVGPFAQMMVISSNPAIAYYDATNGDLVYIRATNSTGSTWGTPIVIASDGDVGRHLSLDVVSGNPAVSYYDSIKRDLKYVRALSADGSSWGTPVTVDSEGDVGSFASLELIDGRPAIAYHEDALDDIKFATAEDIYGATWGHVQTVASEGVVGTSISLIDVAGEPAIRWFNHSTHAVDYCRSSPITGAIINWMAQEP